MSSGLRADSGLNGVAVYSELGDELFIAALYSAQTGTDAQELLNGRYAKRIELKVLSQHGVAHRQFNRIWFESVAINNPQDVLVAHAENMVYFEGLIRDRLESNDHLVISYSPGYGVFVSLNKVQLGHIKSDAFFSVLLRSWIGQVPHTSKFRADLLNIDTADKALVDRFDQMYPRTSRIEIAKSWVQPTAPAAKPVPAVSVATKKAVVDEVSIAQAPAAPARPANIVAKESNVAKQSNAAAAPAMAAVTKSDKAVATSTAVENSSPVDNSPVDGSSVDSSSIERSVAVGSVAAVPAAQALSDAQVLLAKQFYIADVFKKIYAQVNYPRRAQELQQKGTVKLSVVINSAGNIKAVAPIDETKFTLLNKAAMAAVRSAAPFSPLPQGINLAELELAVPITFSLNEL